VFDERVRSYTDRMDAELLLRRLSESAVHDLGAKGGPVRLAANGGCIRSTGLVRGAVLQGSRFHWPRAVSTLACCSLGPAATASFMTRWTSGR